LCCAAIRRSNHNSIYSRRTLGSNNNHLRAARFIHNFHSSSLSLLSAAKSPARLQHQSTRTEKPVLLYIFLIVSLLCDDGMCTHFLCAHAMSLKNSKSDRLYSMRGLTLSAEKRAKYLRLLNMHLLEDLFGIPFSLSYSHCSTSGALKMCFTHLQLGLLPLSPTIADHRSPQKFLELLSKREQLN
jgi:hypothetical protein